MRGVPGNRHSYRELMLISSFNFTTRFPRLRPFAIIALILSTTLLTELYLDILNSLPISSRLSTLKCLIKCKIVFFPHENGFRPSSPIHDVVPCIRILYSHGPRHDFHLSISGRTLDRDDVLSNYDLEDGLEVLIIPVSTAGQYQ